ncbi:TrmB family transcriptional regulator [Scytonema hofmannii PCC 7110]|uniref:TrmB family transcriptional regulator n=1 Tax=Scytonema hofmannii PCC 7110 TaxID=128403 RepID=A0A139WR08_9CYAN|nr:metalloregulator ArsR/SmtB family transcription factor [Scytonema hofmannii]KYC34842.1 TrmB family transcriptional regulator [Scytonema hofmannii PCC 7110]
MLINAQSQAISLKAKLFRGFSDPSRLAILDVLRDGPLTVTEIATVTGLSQSNASNHLGCLRDCGLVISKQEGRYVRYQLSDLRVATVLHLSDRILADVAKGVYECTRYNCQEEE